MQSTMSATMNVKSLLKKYRSQFDEAQVTVLNTKSTKNDIYLTVDVATQTLREQQMRALKRWREEINEKSAAKGEEAILVTNNVDLEGPPIGFSFISERFFNNPADYSPADQSELKCECKGRACRSSTDCCPQLNHATPAYDIFGRLVPDHKGPIFECSNLCKCSKTCVNRQLQNGRQVTLELLRTQSPYQWTVRTLRDLKKGTFVTEIVGEVVDDTTKQAICLEEVMIAGWSRVLDLHEAAHRLASYGPKHSITNLLELRYSDGMPRFVLDKTFFGNIANFIQHSCEPNLEVRLVYSEMHEEAAPRLALFASCDIPAQSPLTVDCRPDPAHYDENEIKRLQKSDLDFIRCNCSAKQCRKVLWVASKK